MGFGIISNLNESCSFYGSFGYHQYDTIVASIICDLSLRKVYSVLRQYYQGTSVRLKTNKLHMMTRSKKWQISQAIDFRL